MFPVDDRFFRSPDGHETREREREREMPLKHKVETKSKQD